MESLEFKYQSILQTLESLREAIELMDNPQYQEIYRTLRDSIIQRFEYSIDAFWKFLKLHMQEKLNLLIDANTPRAILRAATNADLISNFEFEILINAIASRNITSHSYNEAIAQNVLQDIPHYYEIMNAIIIKIKP